MCKFNSSKNVTGLITSSTRNNCYKILNNLRNLALQAIHNITLVLPNVEVDIVVVIKPKKQVEQRDKRRKRMKENQCEIMSFDELRMCFNVIKQIIHEKFLLLT